MSTDSQTRKAALYISLISSFMTAFMGSAITVAIKHIADGFEMNAVMMGWVNTSYLLASAVCLVPAGRLADIYGRKKVFRIGIFVYTLGVVLAILSPGQTMFLVARIVMGTGVAMIFGTSAAILVSAYPPRDRGRALGISVAAVYVGLTAGPFLGGVLTEWWGWRAIFYSNLPLCLAIMAMLKFMLKAEWAEAKGERFDLTGAALLGISIVGLIYGLSILTSPRGMWIFAGGVAAFAIFVLIERKTPQPAVDITLFTGNGTVKFFV